MKTTEHREGSGEFYRSTTKIPPPPSPFLSVFKPKNRADYSLDWENCCKNSHSNSSNWTCLHKNIESCTYLNCRVTKQSRRTSSALYPRPRVTHLNETKNSFLPLNIVQGPIFPRTARTIEVSKWVYYMAIRPNLFVSRMPPFANKNTNWKRSVGQNTSQIRTNPKA